MATGTLQQGGASVETLPGNGIEGYGSYGGPIVVLNDDSLTVTVNGDDPYAIVAAADATHLSVHPLNTNSFGMWLDIYHLYRVNPTITPAIRVFGLVPTKQPASQRFMPFDQDAANWTDVSAGGFWIPLMGFDGTVTVWDTTWTFIDSDALVGTSLANDMIMSLPIRFRTEGCTQIMVSIALAATVTTDSLIVGRLVG